MASTESPQREGFRAPESLPTRRSLRRKSRLSSALGVAGEIMMTLGALVGLFTLWHVVINDSIQGQQQQSAGVSVAEDWELEPQSPSLEAAEDSLPDASPVTPSSEEPPVIESADEGERFALLRVPRFGEGYVRAIGEGVDLTTVLNEPSLGVGRYSQSSELGATGNFALAGHRTTFGASFAEIGALRVGDPIFIEVPEGWFAYQFRNHEYVWPNEVEVLDHFPKQELSEGTHRILTLTSCHPRFSEAERIIAYATFVGWYPRESGPPSELNAVVGEGS